MVVSFFESIKYVGLTLPLSFMRIFIGYVFFQRAWNRLEGDYLMQPRLAALISESLPTSEAPYWYIRFLEDVVIPNWKVFAYILTYCEFLLGLSFIVGFLVRPACLVGIFLCANALYLSVGVENTLYQTYVALLILMLWMGAGRSLGFDYFFYKRRRGIWW